MILLQRSVTVAPGMLSAAMTLANELSARVRATAGTDVRIAVPVGGNCSHSLDCQLREPGRIRSCG